MRRKRKPTKQDGPRRNKEHATEPHHRGIPFDGRAPRRREQQNLHRCINEEIE